MEFKFTVSAAIMAVLSVSLSFGAVAPKKPDQIVFSTPETKAKQMKNILFTLVRQDEYLDEAMETLNTADVRLSSHDIFALSFSLKMIKGNLDNVAAINKIRFTEIQPGSNLSSYTRTILSYSAKMNKKAARIELLSSAMAAKNKKAVMRDAVSSGAGGRRQTRIAKKSGKTGGKNIAQLLEEQQAMKQLSADVKGLKSSLSRLTATSRWLYIVSK